MLRRAVQRPAGRLTDTFKCPAELQGAYDFVEGQLPPADLTGALGTAVMRAVADESRVYVAVDGTSLSLTDRAGAKDFGAIGARGFPTRGLKVINALVVTESGVPVGLAYQEWWARAARSSRSRAHRRRRLLTEMRRWVDTIEAASLRFQIDAPGCRPCFVIDREGDCAAVLGTVSKPGRGFIVRAAQNRPVLSGTRRRKLWSTMRRRPILGTRVIEVPAAPGRRARTSVFDLRTARVTLDLPDRETGKRFQLEVAVVWAIERRAPRGEKRLDWMLLTNEPISDAEAAKKVLDGYCLRWRIEDFHKAWKNGRCRVEETQLRRRDSVIRWATLLAAVATRAEQLKHLARTTPDAPASVALTKNEITGLIAAKKKYGKRTEHIDDAIPTIATAVRWIAELGGYTGKSSGGPPGTITLGRGLEFLAVWAEAYCAGLGRK